jgi:hypothetical protein
MLREASIALSSLMLASCANGEADFGDNTLVTTERPQLYASGLKLLGTYYAQVDSTLVLSTSQSPPQNGKTSSLLSVNLTAFPTNRRFLYLHKSQMLFSDSGSVNTSGVGLLSGADTQSQQDLTTVLGEVAKAAEGFHAADFAVSDTGEPDPCVANLPKTWSATLKVNDEAEESANDPDSLLAQAAEAESSLNLAANSHAVRYSIQLNVNNVQQPAGKYSAMLGQGGLPCSDPSIGSFAGFCAYEPAPIEISIKCSTGTSKTINTGAGTRTIFEKTGTRDLIQPIVLNIYKYSQIENPQRGFLTNPHDSYTMADGVIVGHKYSSDSYIKGVFSFVTTPLRAALPSTTNATQVQTGGGKPDQTTNTTTYVFNPN